MIRALTRRGFVVLREGANHTIMRRATDGAQIVVPRHRELKRGTVRGIAADAGAEWEEFRREVT